MLDDPVPYAKHTVKYRYQVSDVGLPTHFLLLLCYNKLLRIFRVHAVLYKSEPSHTYSTCSNLTRREALASHWRHPSLCVPI